MTTNSINVVIRMNYLILFDRQTKHRDCFNISAFLELLQIIVCYL